MKLNAKSFKVILGIILVLLAIRAVLPEVLKRTINWYLANKVEHYTGHIEDFDLALWRGSYSIEGLHLYQKPKSKDAVPMLYAKDLDVSLAWKALFKGKLLMDLDADQLALHFVDNKEKEKTQLEVNQKSGKEVYTALIPFNIERLRLTNSKITFVNTNNPKVPAKVELSQITLRAENIHNNAESKASLPSTLDLSAKLQKSGDLKADLKFNWLQNPINFDADFSLESLDLTELNSILIEYGPLTFTKGGLSIYGETIHKKNIIKGYIKPFVRKVDVVANEEIFESFKHFGIEMVTAAGNLILRTSDDKIIATKLDFNGDLSSPEFKIWRAIRTAIKNAFNQELEPKVDKVINEKTL